MNKLLIILLLSAVPCMALGQSKKKLKENAIKTQIVWKYSYRNGAEVKFKEAEFAFDEKGRTILEKEYDEQGFVIRHMENAFDSEGNLTTEITYNPKGQIIRKEVTQYNGNLKIERKIYGPDGKLKTRKVYEYTKH